MASLLRPVALESCPGAGLRERRRGSVNSLVTVPRLFTTPYLDHKPVFDENDHINTLTAASLLKTSLHRLFLPWLTYGSATKTSKVEVPKDHDDLPAVYICEVSSPSPSSPTGTVSSRKSQ